MNAVVALIKEDDIEYPCKEEVFFSPADYPEIDKHEVYNNNKVYDMVRKLLLLYGLDEIHYGTEKWNPLGEIINPGDTVLIKPNLVMDKNPVGNLECLYTNPSIVAPLIDYTLLALNGKGRIIVGDAPLQECKFEKLVIESGYKNLIEYYKQKGVNIELKDFRNTKTYVKNGMHYYQNKSRSEDNGILVKLDNYSAFSELGEESVKGLRVTNYDPHLMNQHHTVDIHEYMIAKDLLEADVVINVPKIKTHRIAGITASMKNLIGINANKELLPHHRLGSKEEGGDAYLHKSELLRLANELKDKVNELNAHNKQDEAKDVEEEFEKLYFTGISKTREKYWNGFWYGNDTIWRTIVDLNRIFIYADKKGDIQATRQRKMIILGDMIVAGEKEGPLNPSPIYCGTLVMSVDPVVFDRTVCSLMGFDWKMIPTINNDYLNTDYLTISDGQDPIVISNNLDWNNRKLDDICNASSFHFEPTEGWSDLLPSRIKKESIEKLSTGEPIYIFGAGKIGHTAFYRLMDNNVNISGFVDNDIHKHNSFICDIQCIAPEDLPRKSTCIIAIGNSHVDEVYKQLSELGISHIIKWSDLKL